jgi:hypothetical protein
METALTNAIIMATYSMNVVDKFVRMELTLKEMEPALTYATIMATCFINVVDKFWKGRINPVGDGASPYQCYHHGPMFYGCC